MQTIRVSGTAIVRLFSLSKIYWLSCCTMSWVWVYLSFWSHKSGKEAKEGTECSSHVNKLWRITLRQRHNRPTEKRKLIEQLKKIIIDALEEAGIVCQQQRNLQKRADWVCKLEWCWPLWTQTRAHYSRVVGLKGWLMHHYHYNNSIPFWTKKSNYMWG